VKEWQQQWELRRKKSNTSDLPQPPLSYGGDDSDGSRDSPNDSEGRFGFTVGDVPDSPFQALSLRTKTKTAGRERNDVAVEGKSPVDSDITKRLKLELDEERAKRRYNQCSI
jgi:hypothetical protein